MLHEWLSVFLKVSIQLAFVILPGAPLLWAKATLHGRRGKIFHQPRRLTSRHGS
jgi:hypothetical protein